MGYFDSPCRRRLSRHIHFEKSPYLRLHQGRYYASLDPSETRALASIRGAVLREQVDELLAATARKIVQAHTGLLKCALMSPRLKISQTTCGGLCLPW